jgi:hypothetical protein
LFEIELEKARRELEQLRIEKEKAEARARDDFKRELKYRMRQQTSRYLIPKPKTTIAKKNMRLRQSRLVNYVFTQQQIELAQQILDRQETRA